MRIKTQRIRDAGASTTYIGNSILIMENSYTGGYETLETPNIFLFLMEAWLRNEVPLEIPLGPVTRAKAKRFKEALNVLIQDAQVEDAHVLNSKEYTKMVHVIKVNPKLNKELGRFLA